MGVEFPHVIYYDACTFLAAVLQGVEAVVYRVGQGFFSFAFDTEYSAFFFHSIRILATAIRNPACRPSCSKLLKSLMRKALKPRAG